jgi:hypothetical protein
MAEQLSMCIDLACGICDFTVHVEEASAAQLEYVFDLFTRNHQHTPEQVESYIWANGNHPAGKALEYPADLSDDEEEEDGDGE